MKVNPRICLQVLDSLYDGICVVDRQRRITHWNKGAEVISGFTSSEMVGLLCQDCGLTHVNDQGRCLCTDGCLLLECMTAGRECEAELYLRHKDGHRVPVSVRVTPLRDEKEKVQGAIEIFQCQIPRNGLHARIEQLEEMALLDPLTRLANRRHIEASLRSRLEELKRYDWRFGVVFIDIDRFKSVNDAFGHDVGDKVLKMVTRTLLNSLRPFDVLGRWGGEEFLGVILNVNESELDIIANRARRLVERSVHHGESDAIRVTVSIGATLARTDDTPGKLVNRADALMYASKLAGRNRVTTASAAPSATR